MTSRQFSARLERRAARAGLALGRERIEELETYYKLLISWNSKVNLSGLDLSGVEALDRLLIEPLLAARHVDVRAERAIDIGSGGGSPAIPLVLALPRLHMTLVEAKTRKSVFLREVVRALNLTRCEVVTTRFEQLLSRPDLHEAHHLLTVRAVRVETNTLMSLQAFVKPGGQLFLFRSTATASKPQLIPPLELVSSQPLAEALGSQLLILEKRSVGATDRFT